MSGPPQDLRVLGLDQPWASILADPLLPKTIETRKRPWPSTIPLEPDGAWVLLHANAKAPETFDYEDDHDIGGIIVDDRESFTVCRWRGDGSWTYYHNGDGPHDLPLGAVIGAVRFRESLPMVHTGGESAIRTINCDPNGSLWIVEPRLYPAKIEDPELLNLYVNTVSPWGEVADVDRFETFCDEHDLVPEPDQREITDTEGPFGFYEPGRYGWVSDVQLLLPTPIPHSSSQWPSDRATPELVAEVTRQLGDDWWLAA